MGAYRSEDPKERCCLDSYLDTQYGVFDQGGVLAGTKFRTVYFYEPIMIDQNEKVKTLPTTFWADLHSFVTERHAPQNLSVGYSTKRGFHVGTSA